MRRCPRFNTALVTSALFLLATAGTAAAQQGHPEIISETMAHRYGLTRAWITRVQNDPARGRLTELTLHEEDLISVTNLGTVQALDAETGRTRWITTVGRRSLSMTPVGASHLYVCVCNGSNLYVLSRKDGQILITQRMQGTPSAAPAVTDERVYVPTFAGGIESYEINLQKPNRVPRTYRTSGVIEEAPVLAGENLIWATHAGSVYSARAKDLTAGYRFRTRGQITAGLGYWPPLVYAASADGYIYAIEEKNGYRRWQFSTGFPSHEQPVPLDGKLYVVSEHSGMFCLSADKGIEQWFTRNIAQFVSASATRLYTADSTGRLMILDLRGGAILDVLPTERLPIKVLNIQNDRLYLATQNGLIQCLHEIAQVKPLVHVVPEGEVLVAPAGKAVPADNEPGAAADAPAEDAGGDPFAADPQP